MGVDADNADDANGIFWCLVLGAQNIVRPSNSFDIKEAVGAYRFEALDDVGHGFHIQVNDYFNTVLEEHINHSIDHNTRHQRQFSSIFLQQLPKRYAKVGVQ